METTTCPRSDLLSRRNEELPIEIQHQQDEQTRLHAAVMADLGAAARDPAHHSLFMESCVLCGQTLSAQKGIKQHLNRQHPEVMEALANLLPQRLLQYKVLFHKGDTCRYCRHRIDAPGRHSQQCPPLLQAHVLQEVVNRDLSTQPRDYVPKQAPTRPAQEESKSCSAPGLARPVVQLEGFLLLTNTRNHCYANSSLQCLYWQLPLICDGLMREALRVSQLVRITPEHTSLVNVTSGWQFDGRQHDAAEFLHTVFGNLHPLTFGYWESRKSVPEGVIVNEEGNSPIHIDSQVCAEGASPAGTGECKVRSSPQKSWQTSWWRRI